MTKELMRDLIFLARKLEPATNEDLQVPQDLLDMLIVNKDGCVDMAANMIGVRMQIIVFDNESTYRTMFNPEIIKKSGPYDTEASVFFFSAALVNASATRPIKIQWQTAEFPTRIKILIGWIAQIIQHEIDHCNGVLI